MITVIHFMESETGLRKGKGNMTMSILQVLYDIADSDIDDLLKSPAGQEPQLRVFVQDGHFDFACIVLDSVSIEAQATDVIQALLLLLATYFVFDLSYPRPYCQVLGFLQQYVLGQLYTGFKSSKYVHFCARLGDIS